MIYVYTYKDGKIYKGKKKYMVVPRRTADDVNDKQKPKLSDFIQCIEMLVDFCSIDPPRNGTNLHDVVPKFDTVGELVAWRNKKIRDSLTTGG